MRSYGRSSRPSPPSSPPRLDKRIWGEAYSPRRRLSRMAATIALTFAFFSGLVATTATAYAGTCSPTVTSTVDGNGWYVHTGPDLSSPRTGATVNTGQVVTIDDQELNPAGAVTIAGYGSSAVVDHLAGIGWVSDLSQTSTPYGVFDGQCSGSSGRSHGATRTYNAGVAGQCTWGAYYQWYVREGSYPALTGNADAWGSSARAAGWTVVDVAQANSIVVFQPGIQGASSLGHVAWVTSVSQRSDGLYVTFLEMNGPAGPYKWDYRTVKDVAGMQYVLAP
jgi:surface antigen